MSGQVKKLCEMAVEGADGWECGWPLEVDCPAQMYDYNPDGSVNVVMCGEAME